MKKLTLDLGSSSIGWSISDIINSRFKLINHGVITFDSGMVKGKSGYTSPTQDRRVARNKRVQLQHKRQRKQTLLKTLIKHQMVPLDLEELKQWSGYDKNKSRKYPENESFLQWLACDFSYCAHGNIYKNPYELRVKALDSQLSAHELGRTLYHLVQRRGYKDIGEEDKETKTQKERRIKEGLKTSLQTHRTLGEALQKEFLHKGSRARNQYPFRAEYEDELSLILEKQGYDVHKENGQFTDDFTKQCYKSIIWQQSLKSQKQNVGKCTLENNSKRCPISHPFYELYSAWQDINNIKYYTPSGEVLELPIEVKQNLFENKFLHTEMMKPTTIKTFLNKELKGKYTYNFERQKTKKYGMPIIVALKKLLEKQGFEIKPELFYHLDTSEGKNHKLFNGYSFTELWHILYAEADYPDRQRKFAEEKLGITSTLDKNEKIQNDFQKLSAKIAQGYAHLGTKSIKKIYPNLVKGYLYHEAVLLARLPELIKNWDTTNQNKAIQIVQESQRGWKRYSKVQKITNELIKDYRALDFKDQFAHKDFGYTLDEQDNKAIQKACISDFGRETWWKMDTDEKDEYQKLVAEQYQSFFADSRRKLKEKILNDLIEKALVEQGFELNEKVHLYHHSNLKNIYPEAIKGITKINKESIELLPDPRIPSIKNPMFNKAQTILRKLINHLLLTEQIDNNTKVVVEVAKELNDNNKRRAIEKYQGDRNRKREDIRKKIQELYNEKSISREPTDRDILKYELWEEQEGLCMYTGKKICITDLLNANGIDIEHTIPQSILPDSTRANMTVAFKYYNTDIKKNKIPTQCPNYSEETPEGTAIENRLEAWKKKREETYQQHQSKSRARGREDEENKNNRIRDKHYHKMRFEYWKDKIERFECEEIKDSWVRRQLVDTQIISKYARMYLRTVFKVVHTQKGKVTSDFRKIYGIQKITDEKNRGQHTHHAIDALTLAFIPLYAKERDELLIKYYDAKKFNKMPDGIRSPKEIHDLIKSIEEKTLIYNYTKENILKQTKRKIYDRKGKVVNIKGTEKPMIKTGDTIRGSLFQETYIGKIHNAKRNEEGNLIRDKDGNICFSEKEEFKFVKRVPIDEINEKSKIVDPDIRESIKEQRAKNIEIIRDVQGKAIRHVRIYTAEGREVKERLNYRSKFDYKNNFYSASGGIPWALMLQKSINNDVTRKIIPISLNEIAKVYRQDRAFDINTYIKMFHDEKILEEYPDFHRLYVRQKVFVLQDDEQYSSIKNNIELQDKLLHKITKFSSNEQNIYMSHHKEARDDKTFKKDYGLDDKNKKNEITVQPSYLPQEGIPYWKLKLSMKNCNLLYEGIDFEMDIDGTINWIE